MVLFGAVPAVVVLIIDSHGSGLIDKERETPHHTVAAVVAQVLT